jgi:hypothetical protein
MSEELQPTNDTPEPRDPFTYLVSVGIELHEMLLALVDAGFTRKEALFLVGQAVAAGVMLPNDDLGPDDYDELNSRIDDEDGDTFDDD